MSHFGSARAANRDTSDKVAPVVSSATMAPHEWLMGEQQWTFVELALPYRLGELRLFSRSFSGVASNLHFTRTPPALTLPTPPKESLDEHGFVYYPTYPVQFVPNPITITKSWIAYTPYVFKNHYIDLAQAGTFANYLQTRFSSKSRWTLQRKVRRFAEGDGGSLHCREFSTPSDMSEFQALACNISARTYQERLLGKGFPKGAKFTRRLEESAAIDGVRGYVLFLQGSPIAYMGCFVVDGIMTYNYGGYDPHSHALSPGTVLQYIVLKSVFESPSISIFDFTEGDGAQKAFFATHHQMCAKTYFLKRSYRHLALISIHYGLNCAVEGLGRSLDAIGLRSRVRKLIRSAATH